MTRVLVVDDKPSVQDVLRLLLAEDGFELAGQAFNGKEGIEMAAELQPDIVILDYDMPILRGDEAGPVIRGVAPNAAILFFSSVPMPQPEWADAYLDKSEIVEITPTLRSLESERVTT